MLTGFKTGPPERTYAVTSINKTLQVSIMWEACLWLQRKDIPQKKKPDILKAELLVQNVNSKEIQKKKAITLDLPVLGPPPLTCYTSIVPFPAYDERVLRWTGVRDRETLVALLSPSFVLPCCACLLSTKIALTPRPCFQTSSSKFIIDS